MTRSSWLATVLVLGGPVIGTAQERPASGLPELPLSRYSVADAVVVRGAPRSYQVISVPVPDPFAGMRAVGYTVEQAAGMNVIGRRAGTLDPRSNRAALVTIGLPASVPAGPQPAATVVFAAAGDSIAVPVVIDVTPIRRIVLGSRSRIDDLEPGERFDFAFQVTNLGNAPDTVHADLNVPNDWRVRQRAFGPTIIAAGKSHAFVTRVDVPDRSGTGGFFFRIRAHGVDTTGVQERTITLTVGERFVDNAPPGPVLRAGVGSASVDGRAPESLAHLSVIGTVAADIAIDARIATTPNLGSNAVRGLNRVGAFIGEPRLSLSAPAWHFDAGSTVSKFTDLTGVNAGAKGIAYAYDGAERELGLLLGRPLYTETSDRGHLVGLRGGSNVGPARISAAFTSLDATASTRQKLTAAGIEGEMKAFGLGTFGSELAWRDYVDGSGLGWRVNWHQQNERGHVSARVLHAPGGSAAFAYAVDEITLSADRSFGRFHLSGSLLSASDHNATFDDMESNSWSITPQYRVTDRTALRLSARGAAYDVRGAAAFGNRETGVIAGVTSQAGNLFYTAEAGIERFSRSITLDGEEFTSSAPRYSWRSGASYVTPYAVLQFETAYDRTGEALSPEQLLILMRAERMRFSFLPSSMYFDAELTHQRWAGDRSFFTSRIGASYTALQGLDVSASIERNPLASGFSGSTPVVFALRVDKMISLPRMRYGTDRGRVFQDLNGNGVYDTDEPGVPHITVQRAGVRAVTDRNGVYTFWDAQQSGPVVVDAATLPHGWILAEATAAGRDVALAPTSSIAVKLELGIPERARAVDVSNAVVIARDESGREWIARRTGPELAVFEALPVGTYTLEFNFAASGEPLRPDRTYIVTVRSTGTENVTVRLQGRPLRFRSTGG